VKWWIDASFAVHPDMKSHTGGTMSLGKGSVYCLSRKQHINTKSSTEAELVGVDDGMPLMIWTRNFLQAQGFKVHATLFFRITRVLSYWRRMARHQVVIALDTWTFTTSSLLTESRAETFVLNIVRRETWWRTSSPSHCRAACFVSCGRSF
jgi:hypothetical protein